MLTLVLILLGIVSGEAMKSALDFSSVFFRITLIVSWLVLPVSIFWLLMIKEGGHYMNLSFAYHDLYMGVFLYFLSIPFGFKYGRIYDFFNPS